MKMNVTGYTKIALFFIVLGAAGGVFIVASADNLNDFNTREYEIVLDDAIGLSTRSKIYQAGVVVGRIKGITLSDNEAILRIALLRDLTVREDAVVSRRTSTMLGTSILVLEPGHVSSRILPPGGRLQSSRDTGDISSLMGSVQDLSSQISDILREFQYNHLTLLAISLETFNSIAQKIDSNTDAELERLSRILESIALITGDIGLITGDIRQGSGNISQAIYDDRLYSSLLTTTGELEVAILKLQNTLDSINIAATGASTVIDSANVIVQQVVGLGLQVDTHGSYFAQANQVQAGASVRLVPASNDRWYRIGVTSVPGGRSSRTVTDTHTYISNPLDNVRTIEDTTKTDYSSFVVDAELARSFGILTIRGGLLESTGGIGLDVQPLKWLGISGEVFNFRSGESPNLRGTVTIYPFFDPDSDKPWNWLYLRGGINNSLTNDRDFFIGGGMRFADREVKGLIGLIPALN